MQGVQEMQYSPKTADHPDTDNTLVIYTQNIQGIRSNEEKLEYISRMMESKSIDAFMIQEMHLEGDFFKILLKGQLLIHHGPNVQPHQGAKGGVAIILSPEMGTNWRNGGSAIRKGETTVGDMTRLLSIDVQIKTKVIIKTKSKIKHMQILLLSSYHPTSGYSKADANKFNLQVSAMINQISEKNILIMGADLNASIGTRLLNDKSMNARDCKDPSADLLGPHGNA